MYTIRIILKPSFEVLLGIVYQILLLVVNFTISIIKAVFNWVLRKSNRIIYYIIITNLLAIINLWISYDVSIPLNHENWFKSLNLIKVYLK